MLKATLGALRVRDHMLLDPVVVNEDTDLFEAIHRILANRISGVTVVDAARMPVGMLSELDCLRATIFSSYYGEAGGRVRDYMSTPVETVHQDADILTVATDMLEHRRRRRPVVDDAGRLVGQVTCRQLLRAIKDFQAPRDPSEG